MTDVGSAGFSQADRTLTAAAGHVTTARGEVTKRCQQLGGQLAGLSGQWAGEGATAFQRLMLGWQEKQKTILDALGELSRALQETERDTAATDQSQAQAVSRLHGRLG